MKKQSTFKLRSGNKPSIAKLSGVMKESPAKLIYGKKTTTKNDDGSTTTTRKGIFGGTKTVTKSADGTTKTVQKMNKGQSRGTVKVKSKTGGKVTKTKTKISNYGGTDDYKITKQKQTKKTVKGKVISRKKNTGGSISGVESGFQDPRLNRKGEWKDRSAWPSSYDKAEKRFAKGKMKLPRR
mgnify:CR=1 FL=1|tara:strand:+ start:43 stop:588 length:546 start_codon:yes stop_codon:yes gene_type:complete